LGTQTGPSKAIPTKRYTFPLFQSMGRSDPNSQIDLAHLAIWANVDTNVQTAVYAVCNLPFMLFMQLARSTLDDP